jgi:hypothetical protein
MLEEADELVRVLWDLFLPEITSGEPVRFCFSHDMLRDHFVSSSLNDREPLAHICAVARYLFSVSGNRALLLPDALSEGQSGVSKAIILVCQQILAVEEMISEGAQYSENAYFPRLRRLMDENLPLWSANPFTFDEFEDIWKTFAREVWRVEGSSDQTITFEFGSYAGANKSRQFPLSQALFSSGDLAGLAAHCRLDKLRSESADDVWTEIRRERYHLCRRAQRLINSGFLRERLIEQVQNFAGRVSVNDVEKSGVPGQSPRTLSLFISLDVTDWVHEEYRAFLASSETGIRVEDTAEIAKRIDTFLTRRDYVFCALNKLKDCWTVYEGEVEVGAGDPLLLLARQAGIQRGKTLLVGLDPSLTLDEARVRSLGADNSIYVAPVTLSSSLNRSITIRAGGIVEGAVRDLGSKSIFSWLGGLCLDGRTTKYLLPFLPSGIRFGPHEYSAEQLQRVSGSRMDWKSFVAAVARLETDASYDMLFPNGYEARLTVAVPRKRSSERMGFLFDPNGRLSPTLERLGLSDPAIVGFSCPDHRVERPADVRTVAKLLRDLKDHKGRPLTEKERRVAWNRVNTSVVPPSVKRVIAALLKGNPSAQKEVIDELLQ